MASPQPAFTSPGRGPAMVDTEPFEIPEVVKAAHEAFASKRSRPLKWRKAQIAACRKMVEDNREAIAAAVAADLGRPRFECEVGESLSLIAELDFMAENLEDWMQDKAVPTPAVMQPGSSRIVMEPKGVVLVLGAWNFPFMLTLLPAMSAIAAGNCAIIKPSELAPAVSCLIGTLVPQYLDKVAVQVVRGGVTQAKALLQHQFNHIFFTGGASVGSSVMKAAARHLTPVTLELGGKSPAIVAADANLSITVKRIASAKFFNAGQVCIAPDYVIIEAAVEDEFVRLMIETLKAFYGEDPKASKDFGRIVNEAHFSRIKSLLDTHDGEVAFGGDFDASEKYIGPTLLRRVTSSSSVMREEIFGPVLPIITVASIPEAISFVNTPPLTQPLAMYCFSSSKATQDAVVEDIRCGGVCINDAIMQHANPNLPFGGVGTSGMGSYHGKFGFDAMSHQKAVFSKPTWMDVALRYPPYTSRGLSIVSWLVLNARRLRLPFGRRGFTLLALVVLLLWMRRRR